MLEGDRLDRPCLAMEAQGWQARLYWERDRLTTVTDALGNGTEFHQLQNPNRWVLRQANSSHPFKVLLQDSVGMVLSRRPSKSNLLYKHTTAGFASVAQSAVAVAAPQSFDANERQVPWPCLPTRLPYLARFLRLQPPTVYLPDTVLEEHTAHLLITILSWHLCPHQSERPSQRDTLEKHRFRVLFIKDEVRRLGRPSLPDGSRHQSTDQGVQSGMPCRSRWR